MDYLLSTDFIELAPQGLGSSGLPLLATLPGLTDPLKEGSGFSSGASPGAPLVQLPDVENFLGSGMELVDQQYADSIFANLGMSSAKTTTAVNASQDLLGDSLAAVNSVDSGFSTGSGVFTVGETGVVSFDYLINGGEYQIELATSSQEGRDQFEFFRSDQPLIGIIDTGFSANNPDIDYSRVLLGRDRIDGDDNPLLAEGEGNEHGTHVLNVIAATQDNGIGINGINDDAPLWVGRAVGSGKWAESLVEFVDTAKASGQPNAIVNLSFDLVQANPDGSVTTRYELTLQERAALNYAHQNSVLIVASAGNEGGAMSALGQAAQEFDNIIVAGAVDGLDRANYSSYGNGLTLLAEGDMGNLAGTSAAAAKVTGAASQAWAANPELDYHQVIDVLKTTATDLQTSGWDAETGAGLLSITDAISTAAITTPAPYETPEGLTPPTLTSQMAGDVALERPDAWWDPRDWWDDIKDFGSAVGSGVWNGLKKGAEGAEWVYNQADDKLIGSFERTIEWVKKLPSQFMQLGNDYVDFLKAVGKGDFEGAAKAYGRILVDYVDLSGIPEYAETLADWTKFNTRSLTSEEIETARSVFGDSINYSLVRVDEGSLLVLGRKFITGVVVPSVTGKDLTGGDDAPLTTSNTINSLGSMPDETLIHELTHVWQYQHGGSIYLPEAAGAQITEGRDGAYNYEGVAGLQEKIANGQGLFNFNPEQQAKIVEDYYRTKYKTGPDDDIYLSLYSHFVKEVSTLSEDQLAKLPTDSGNTLGTARNLDPALSNLNGTVALRESVGSLRFGWTGWLPSINTDEADVYRLNLTSGNLNLTLAGMTADADVRVIQDINGNSIVDDGEVIASSTLGGSEDEAINLTGLAAGDYFVEVSRYSGNTNYNLNIST